MTLVDAETHVARGRLEAALEELERARIAGADLTAPLARAVVLLGRYLLATER